MCDQAAWSRGRQRMVESRAHATSEQVERERSSFRFERQNAGAMARRTVVRPSWSPARWAAIRLGQAQAGWRAAAIGVRDVPEATTSSRWRRRTVRPQVTGQ